MLNSDTKRYLIQAALFIATILTTSMAGAVNMGLPADSFWGSVLIGTQYAVPFLGILTAHEFGHYLVARHYGIKTTLPYYIPFFLPFAGLFQIGTFGAFIKMEGSSTRKQMFDIGIAGPLAGFVAALLVMAYGFTHLPEPEYIYKVHPSYEQFGREYAKTVYTEAYAKTVYWEHRKADSLQFLQAKKEGWYTKLENIGFADGNYHASEFVPEELALGNNLLFIFFEKYVVDDPAKMPNRFELYHYPLLFAAYMALFFTALNLIPVGQLDGGHVIYGLFGPAWHRRYVPVIFAFYVTVGGLGIFKSNLLGINFFNADLWNMFLFGVMYLYFLYYMFSKAWPESKTNALMVASIVFTVQFMVEYFFPSFKGFSGWYVFAFIIARFLGVHHPVMPRDQPLDLKRKILGWLCLVIFIICFSPEVLSLEVLK